MSFKNITFIIILGLFLIICPHLNAQNKLSDIEIDKRVEALLAKMTLEEKAGQMLNIGLPAILKGSYWDARETALFDTTRMALFLGKYGAGCIHNTPGYPPKKEEWYQLIKIIQDYSKGNTRLGIPVIYGIDNIHGANYVLGSTLLPQQIALAATWSPKMAFRSGEITSYESRAASLVWNYNPNVDVAFQPLWGRMGESFGEDPYLVSQLGMAYTQGSQNRNLQKNTNTAVCLKHFLGYGDGTNGKDRASAIISEINLRQNFIPPFKSAIDSGAMAVMLSSNSVNGIPCHINKYYITDILKGELGFKGVVVSDFSDIDFLITAHQVAADLREATKMAINAGLDMAMNPYDAKVVDLIIEMAKSGEISMTRIDDAVSRILRLKFKLNLFEVPYNQPSEYPDFGSTKFAGENFEMACEAITLLKNESVLPLQKNKKVLITGFTANSINCLNGAWSRSFQGTITKFNDLSKLTILGAVKKEIGANNVLYCQGTDYEKDMNSDSAVLLAKNSDYIIACVGEISATEKPSDINDLTMPEVQLELIRKLSKTGKPIILVLVEGRPRIIKDIEPLAKGIILAYLPGDEGGKAISAVLFGDKNPSGKLPYTYPKFTGNILPYYHKKTDIRDVNWDYNGFYPQYEFGYGQSYTSFEYSGFNLSTDTLKGNDNLIISVSIKNTGKLTGKEVVECYLQDLVASISPDLKRLIRFTKIELKPEETQTVKFTINKKDLAFVGFDNKWVTEPGNFNIFIGGNPKILLSKGFYLK